MVIQGDVITLSEEELKEIINLECKGRLGITLDEFLRKRGRGELSQSLATQEIEMLLNLAYKK